MYISAGGEAECSAKTSGCQPDCTCVHVRATGRRGRFIYLFIYFLIFFFPGKNHQSHADVPLLLHHFDGMNPSSSHRVHREIKRGGGRQVRGPGKERKINEKKPLRGRECLIKSHFANNEPERQDLRCGGVSANLRKASALALIQFPRCIFGFL